MSVRYPQLKTKPGPWAVFWSRFALAYEYVALWTVPWHRRRPSSRCLYCGPRQCRVLPTTEPDGTRCIVNFVGCAQSYRAVSSHTQSGCARHTFNTNGKCSANANSGKEAGLYDFNATHNRNRVSSPVPRTRNYRP